MKGITFGQVVKVWGRVAIPLFCALLLALGAAHVALAQDGGGGDGGGGDAGAAGAGAPLVAAIVSIVKMFLKIIIFSSGAIFAASLARGTFSAQLANLVGSPVGMSQAWLNIIAGIFTFVLTVLSPMIVDAVFNVVKGPALQWVDYVPTF